MLRFTRYTVFTLVIATLAIMLSDVVPNLTRQTENTYQNNAVNEYENMPVLSAQAYDGRIDGEQISDDIALNELVEEITTEGIENTAGKPNTFEGTATDNEVFQTAPRQILQTDDQSTQQISNEIITQVPLDTSIEQSSLAAIETTVTPPEVQEAEPLIEEPFEEITEVPSDIETDLPCH